MTDLAAAIREAIDETERIARAATGDSVFDGTGIVTGPRGSAVMLSTAARHIARHDPASGVTSSVGRPEDPGPARECRQRC